MPLNRIALLVLTSLLCAPGTATGCPPSTLAAGTCTLAMNKAESQQWVLAEFIGAAAGSRPSTAGVAFRVVETSHSAGSIVQGEEILEFADEPRHYKTGQRYILSQERGQSSWSQLVPANRQIWSYVSQLPEPADDATAKADRLKFFFDYLNHNEPVIATDAFAEFNIATPEVLESLRRWLPTDKLRKLVADPRTNRLERPLFSLMLGLCGRPSDIRIIEAQMPTIEASDVPDLHRAYVGYILLAGQDGFDTLSKAKSVVTTVDRNGAVHRVPFIQSYAWLRGTQYLWDSPLNPVPKAKLLSTVYGMLERPGFSDLAVVQLTRWNDWSATTRLMAMFHEDKQQRSAQR